MAASDEKHVAFFARALLREKYTLDRGGRKRARPGEHTYDTVAETLGVPKPQVYDLLNRLDATGKPKGFGRGFERQLAEKFFSGSIDKLHRAAERWWELHGADVEPVQRALDFGPSTSDPKAGRFLDQLGHVPGLEEWVRNSPEAEAISLGELAQGVEAIVTKRAAAYARPTDQQPHGGWPQFFSDLRAGKYERRPPAIGAVDLIREAEGARRTKVLPAKATPRRSTRA